jgi:stage III sporulation protein AF
MSWLNEWMREVIMVVLLATFVDLILPSRSMERYVKLVLSLLILLTLLQPIINLFKDSPEQKLSAAFKIQELNSTHFTNGKETTLQQILSQAEQMKHQQQTESLQWAGEEVAQQMKQQIQDETGSLVQEVKVILALIPAKEANEQASPSITSVDVVLQQEPEDLEGPSNQDDQNATQQIAIAPIAPVEVDVKVEPVKQGSSPNGGVADKKSTEVLSRIGSKAEEIEKLLRVKWNLQSDQIQIKQIEGNGKI